MKKEEAIKKGILQNKKIRLKPILKAGKMIKDPKHMGYFMFNDAFKNYVLPRSRKTGSYISILDDDELKYFSEALQTDLSFTKKVDNFWDKYSFRITKNDNLMTLGVEFDLSDPYSNLDYRLMKSLNITAPDYASRTNHPKYKWYLAEENEELEHASKIAEKEEEALIFFGGLKNSRKKLIDIISVYYAEKSRSNEVNTTATVEFLQNEVRKIVKADKDFILKCKEDPIYEIKALIIDGVRAGAVTKSGRNKYNIIGDSSNYDYIGMTKRLSQLKEDSDDDYLRITEQVNRYREENKIED